MPRIVVELSKEEWELVKALAEIECRPPRYQARLMVRRAVQEALAAHRGQEVGAESQEGGDD